MLAAHQLQTLYSPHLQHGAPAATKEGMEQALGTAEAILRKADAIERDHPLSWLQKGFYYLAKKEYAFADDQFKLVLGKYPHALPALFGQGALFYAEGKYSEALHVYQTILKLCPTCQPDPRLGIALCYARLNAIPQARKALLRVLQLDPENHMAHAYYGRLGRWAAHVFEEEDRARLTALALDSTKKAWTLSAKSNIGAGLELADVFFHKKDAEKALLLCNKGIASICPDYNAEAYYQLGRATHVQQEYNEAKKCYEQALSADPKHAHSQFGLAQVLFSQQPDHPQQAIELLEKWVATHTPVPEEVYALLARAYGRVGAHTKHRATWRDIKALKNTAAKTANESAIDDALEYAYAIEQEDAKEALDGIFILCVLTFFS